MDIRISRGVRITLDRSDRLNVNGVQYADQGQLCLYEAGGGDSVTIDFPDRKSLLQFANKILKEVAETEDLTPVKKGA